MLYFCHRKALLWLTRQRQCFNICIKIIKQNFTSHAGER